MRSKSNLAWAMFAIFVVATLVAAQDEKRLTPAEIEALPSTEAGAGTSGVSGIQTRVLKGDPTKPGLYTIQLFDEHITGTPTFYINEVRYTGATDVDSLVDAILQADTERRIRLPERHGGIRGVLDRLHRR